VGALNRVWPKGARECGAMRAGRAPGEFKQNPYQARASRSALARAACARMKSRLKAFQVAASRARRGAGRKVSRLRVDAVSR
jgi:hypothetical protein